ncbi:MAG TPA: HAD family hydrolase [Geminicoccus sp.]|uniref:HAD family hydrolase n=1 Tax=Geminicoccus sp. TaxID=2024832 RepID=UPI002D1D4C95|nr:HAD family hydrolase [Geminicoccus sp.]HWL69545.1 HAD family hydrolase [Geminicoccus sp.]
MITAVIFDMDGTLIDSVDLHAASWQRTFTQFGFQIDFTAIRSQIGKGGDQLMPVFLSEEEVDRLGADMEQFRKHLFQQECLPKVRGFAGVPDLFRRILTDDKRTAIASSAKQDELASFEEIAGVRGLVSEKTSSDDAQRSKPFPDIFQAALKRLAIPADQAVVIGDSPHDAEAAGAAGIVTIGLLCGGFPEADLRRAGCAEIYRDPKDLLRNYDLSLLGRR